MNNELQRWSAFAQQTAGHPPRPLLVEAIPFCEEKGEAIDLGAGSLDDVRYLLEQGFAHVTALDLDTFAQETADTFDQSRFSYIASRFETFDFPQNDYDFVSAHHTLPFISPQVFFSTMEQIIASVKPGGILCGNVFGLNDDWVGERPLTFVSKEQVDQLLTPSLSSRFPSGAEGSSLEVIKLQEREYDGVLVSGQKKHWHLFEFIVKKK